MLFNSFEFAIYLVTVFLLYWFVFNKQLKLQNLFLLTVSYIFYGWWDWRFLILIAFSTCVDFIVGILLEKTINPKTRKLIFALSCIVNIGLLGFFKYCNFFIDSLNNLFQSLGCSASLTSLNIILPVGISFYTFQSLSYTIDVYKQKMKPTHNFISFAAFISFFPQLVAGPIERARHILPQFLVNRQFNYEVAKSGMRQILWGLFKKIVIADSCSTVVDNIFANYSNLPGSTLVLGAIYFSIQIYCDFSGYSSIAIGTAKLFGFSLKTNFSFPYFSKSVAEFWRNWHISLSTWFRDYVYIPLGGSKGTLIRTILNILIVFTISGFWHGANTTFIIWGALNGFFLIPSVLKKSSSKKATASKLIPSVSEFVSTLFTFSLITFAWIFFRSVSITNAIEYIKTMFSKSLFTYPVQHSMALILPLILFLFIIEWIDKNYTEFFKNKIPIFFRWSAYMFLAITCLVFYKQDQAFIYFQF
jgi:D-alanyl-lipoteichoic acid acyltransferase DltB (MBOAT superfamily)